MKTTVYLLLVLAIQFSASAQMKPLKHEIYRSQQTGFVSSELWLNNDSTFYLSNADCISANISKGFWSIINDTLILNSSFSPGMAYTFTFSNPPSAINEENDSLQIAVNDLYGLPAKYFELTLFNKRERPLQIHADDNGMSVVEARRFEKFMTNCDELDFQAKDFWDSSLHSIDPSMTNLSVVLNYPQALLLSRNSSKIVALDAPVKYLIKDRKTLIDCNSRIAYKKDIKRRP